MFLDTIYDGTNNIIAAESVPTLPDTVEVENRLQHVNMSLTYSVVIIWDVHGS